MPNKICKPSTVEELLDDIKIFKDGEYYKTHSDEFKEGFAEGEQMVVNLFLNMEMNSGELDNKPTLNIQEPNHTKLFMCFILWVLVSALGLVVLGISVGP